MLCWGCSTRDWLSPVGGLLELLVRARGCGLSTKNGGWVPSVKCRSISELFFSWRVCVMSSSRTTVYRAQKNPTEKQPKRNCDQFHRMSERCWLVFLDFSDRPPWLILPPVNHRLRHETPAPRRPPPSAPTACRGKKICNLIRPPLSCFCQTSANFNPGDINWVGCIGSRDINSVIVIAYTPGFTTASRSILTGSKSKPWALPTLPRTQAAICKLTQDKSSNVCLFFLECKIHCVGYWVCYLAV